MKKNLIEHRRKKRFLVQHYTNEDWDLIRAKIEANAELSKSMLGSELQGEDFCKEMVDLVNQERSILLRRARAKRNKPMTHLQLKDLDVNYLRIKGIDDDEPTKKSGRRKQMARKGMHTSVDKNDSEDSDEVGEHEESTTGTETPINPVPVAMKTPSVATYKIIKQGEKGVYQIVREDGTDIVYINFGAMLKSISRDDLTELVSDCMTSMDGWDQRAKLGRILDMFKKLCLKNLAVCQTMLKMKLLDGKMNEDCYRLLKMMEKQAGIRK
ncbi:hypothetical protein Tco_0878197 [Tanacetum coccineum]|uniref:Uncharacterized protein n=1 Tax=Tanacetum coccineum TaxID=301880 RepID=A0ABQ5BXB3_9ASTR